jgi:hypothetical protein
MLLFAIGSQSRMAVAAVADTNKPRGPAIGGATTARVVNSSPTIADGLGRSNS